MIPQADIVAWRQVAPWADDAMVEQDLVLSRALVEIFSDATLAGGLAMRGGTALNKLVLLPASRYWEDIDLVQVRAGPIGGILNAIQARLNPVRRLRLKVEIHTRQHFSVYGNIPRPFAVASRWFTGQADIQTYELDELLATKLRALFQRRRGRDLFDLWDALRRARVDPSRVIAAFQKYMEAEGHPVTRSQFERDLAGKAQDQAFLGEVRPMLPPEVAYDPLAALDVIRREFVERLPGAPWKGK